MRNKKVLFITNAALIAAIYVVMTYFCNTLNLAKGQIQVRFSEVLTILPFFTPAAIPGLFIGCFLSNILIGATILDIIFGSLATLIGAIGTYLLRKNKYVCTLPPVIVNMIIVPLVLKYGAGLETIMFKGLDVTLIVTAITVGIGEVISVCILGSMLLRILCRYRNLIFREDEIDF